MIRLDCWLAMCKQFDRILQLIFSSERSEEEGEREETRPRVKIFSDSV